MIGSKERKRVGEKFLLRNQVFSLRVYVWMCIYIREEEEEEERCNREIFGVMKKKKKKKNPVFGFTKMQERTPFCVVLSYCIFKIDRFIKIKPVIYLNKIGF